MLWTQRVAKMQTWLNKLKIALAEEDVEELGRLFTQKPPNASTDELYQALALSNEALSLVEKKKNALANTINKIKTAKEFLKA